MAQTHSHRHRKPLFHRRTAPGASPGSLVADPLAPKPVVRLTAYNGEKCVECELRTTSDFKQIPQFLEQYPVTWVNVEGLGDSDVVRRLGDVFGLHSLALEDVLNTHQRAKVEQYGDHLFIVARRLEGESHVHGDQLAMFLGKRFVVTFHHRLGDGLDPVRERIRQARGVIRTSGPDYLAYAVLDCVVDSYFPILEHIGELIENLEGAIIGGTDRQMISRIHAVKSRLLALRRAIWPLREALHALVRDPTPVIQEETRVFLRDCADHTFQIIDLVETYRELTGDLMELYHSSLANRMNEVMQVLTVIATIFIPLTFVAGVYGMNFIGMPELKWRWGYPAVWMAMASIAGGLLLYFRYKGWLPRGRSPAAERAENDRSKLPGN
jgi:magnesium transporter